MKFLPFHSKSARDRFLGLWLKAFLSHTRVSELSCPNSNHFRLFFFLHSPQFCLPWKWKSVLKKGSPYQTKCWCYLDPGERQQGKVILELGSFPPFRTLPWACVLRIWDMFMCEGVKVLFRVALVIMRYTLTRSVRKRCPSMYETLDALKHLPVRESLSST